LSSATAFATFKLPPDQASPTSAHISCAGGIGVSAYQIMNLQMAPGAADCSPSDRCLLMTWATLHHRDSDRLACVDRGQVIGAISKRLARSVRFAPTQTLPPRMATSAARRGCVKTGLGAFSRRARSHHGPERALNSTRECRNQARLAQIVKAQEFSHCLRTKRAFPRSASTDANGPVYRPSENLLMLHRRT
jgi:hypothetical protein